MNIRRIISFAGIVMIAHVITYVFIGAFGYGVFTWEFYQGANPLFSIYLRTPSDPPLWEHVKTWMITIQILRGFLIAVALYPFFEALKQKAFWKRFLSIAGLTIILGFWANASPAPGRLEGWLMLKPFVTSYVHLKVQPELLIQGVAMSACVSWWMAFADRWAVTSTRKAIRQPPSG